ncbi:AAA family ATPase [Pseudomonas syringae]|uniref:AAA family ATPase n=1 Tax=Pseudomonas syringae TaxID=317 RepID=UPI001F0ECBB2|nr:AAA family ATPase [Pseudomonas syringae]MCH5514102.1 AAA family ATPase [Pseudomonas syringae pv. syringae]MCH5628072.1 AAA family ATPase [Pseudomonas syringae pv. syringae]
MKIKKVEIEGFRAYKNKADGTFDFTSEDGEPSDFVAIYAPNGFGKSSFYDAIEWAATNHLERLGGEYNKSNYEYAAKITKEDGVGQKILRNRDVPSNVITRVIVSTTRAEPFDRDIKHIRSNSRDLRNDGKAKENDYFRKVILGQDEIDRFLREARPQDRYDRFMKSFGGDAEISRKEISILINDNKSALAELVRLRDSLHEQLKIPVDSSVFNKFNQVVLELNEEGERFPLADETFSISTEHELLSGLVARSHELEVERELCDVSQVSLTERLSRLPEIQLNLDLIAEQQPRLSKLSKGVIDSQNYLALSASYAKCQTELQAANERLEKLIEIDRFASEYIKIESDVQADTEQHRIIAMSRAENASLLENLELSIAQQKAELSTVDSRSLYLRGAVDNCGPIYAEILTNQGRLSLLDSQISENDIALSLDKAQYDSIESELSRVSALNITSETLLSTDMSAINFDKIEELAECSEELNSWLRHDQTIQSTQRALSDQMGLHERLIATGLEYLSLWPTDSCPLCNQLHQSSEDLKAQVTSSSLLSSLSKENSEKLEVSSQRQDQLKKNIEALTRAALELQFQKLAYLRKKINDLGERYSGSKRKKAALMVEKQTIQAQIKRLQESVWGLTKEELGLRAEGEIKTLSIKRDMLLAQLAELNGHVDMNKLLIADQDSTIAAIKTRISVMVSGSGYQNVADYLKENGLSSGQLILHCSKSKADLQNIKEAHRSDGEHFSEECKKLYEVMLSDGTWFDFSMLAAQKDQVETQVARSQSLVDAFIQSLTRLIGPQNGVSLSTVKENIVKFIENFALKSDYFDDKINKINLLVELVTAFKPYVTSLALKQELIGIECKLFERCRVDEVLNLERENVIAKLKDLINGFFYEDLINAIYRKIDPHPSFKQVEFRPDFTLDRPGLNVVVKDEKGDSISPILYFSAAQANILSLSVFLASALHAKDDDGIAVDVILIDDPIQSMDSINVLATIDLLRSICMQFKKQIIISTHDENFFGLLQRKIPSQVLGSKFLKLEKFGVVVPAEPFLN